MNMNVTSDFDSSNDDDNVAATIAQVAVSSMTFSLLLFYGLRRDCPKDQNWTTDN